MTAPQMIFRPLKVFLAKAIVLALRRVEPTSVTMEKATEPTVMLVMKGQRISKMACAHIAPFVELREENPMHSRTATLAVMPNI